MIDLTTRAGIEDFVTNEQKWAVREFKKDGGLAGPHAIVFATIDPRTGEPFDPIGIVPIWPHGMRGTAKDKEAFTRFVEGIAVKCRAMGVLIVMEVWMVMADRTVDPARYEQLKTHRGSIDHESDRTEAIVLSLEHLAFPPGQHMWFGRITRDAAGVGTVAAFEYHQPGNARGRFLNLFHRENFA